MNFAFRTVQFGFMHIWPLLVMAVAATQLPPSALGSVAIIMSVATLFRPLVGMSLGRTTLRYAGEAFAKEGVAGRDAAVGLALRLGIIASVLALVAAVPVMRAVNRFYDLDAGPQILFYTVAFIYLFGLTEFFDGIYRTVGKFRQLAVSVVVSRIVGLALFTFWLPVYGGVATLVLCLALSELVAVVLLMLGARGLISGPAVWRYNLRSTQSARLLSYAAPVIINAVSVYLYARVMVMIVGLYVSSADTGAFEIAVQISNLPMAVTIICASVMSPVIGRLIHQGEAGLRAANEIASYGAAFTVWVSVMAALYLMIVAPFVLQVWFPQLEALPMVMMIIAPLVAAKAFAQFISGEIAIATGAAATAARITLVFGGVTVGLGFALSPSFGVTGAAFAMLIAHLGAVVATVVILTRKTGLTLRYHLWATVSGGAMIAGVCGVVVWTLRHDPASAALWGTVAFCAALIAVLVTGWRSDAYIVAPVRDGLRMIHATRTAQSVTDAPVAKAELDTTHTARDMTQAVLDYCRLSAPDAAAFWLDGTGEATAIAWQDHADMVYTLRFLDRLSQTPKETVQSYLNAVADADLYGRIRVRQSGQGAANSAPTAHMTAYVLGAARLVEDATGCALPAHAFEGWDLAQIIDPASDLPRYPKAWSHHIWRVSHWIGGGPSIVLNLSRWGKVDGINAALLERVLTAIETQLLDPHTDRLHPYRSALIQKGFRVAYKIRHDPEIADIGGLVHILWIYHATGREYRNRAALYDASWCHLRGEVPFMEHAPYCLDFDIIQLMRTAQPTPEAFSPDAVQRAAQFVDDTAAYIRTLPQTGYTLHRLTGALAAMHEAALILGGDHVAPLGVAPVDIIKEAGWL